jgi:FkbM family methyltransferase
MFISFAQNLEDVVLWRALGDVAAGTYVDVGAADPTIDSVTRAFYERGWSGLNVEPVPEYVDRLRAARPRDVTIDACAGDGPGRADLAAVAGTGLSTLVASVRSEIEADGYGVETLEVRVDNLDALLVEAGFEGRDIHFMKIDVEGFEGEVIKGIDLRRWHPWVLVVEATHPRTGRPTHETWEPVVLESGYHLCLFDGLNRFYAAPEHPELVERLSYPACVLDHPFLSPPHRDALDELERVLGEHARFEAVHQETITAFQRQEAELARTIEAYQRQEGELARTIEAYQRQEGELARTIEAYQRKGAELVRTVEALEQAVAARVDAEAVIYSQREGVQHMQWEIEELRSSVDELRARLAIAESRAAEAEQVAEQISGSTIWRLSAPVRQGLDIVRRR